METRQERDGRCVVIYCSRISHAEHRVCVPEEKVEEVRQKHLRAGHLVSVIPLACIDDERYC